MESRLFREPHSPQSGKDTGDRKSAPVPTSRGLKMNGLRMYTKVLVTEPRSVAAVFYSRRGEGPFYLWRYEEKLGQWRGSRVSSGDLTPRELLMASWKIVPSALQTKLSEHYLD